MSGVNKVILIGHLGKDPEVRVFNNGDKIANVSIATSDKYKDQDGSTVENTEWHNIVFNKTTAERAEKYLKKGDKVYVEGKLRTRSWEKDGVTRYTTEVLVYNLTMLGRASSQINETTTAATVNQANQSSPAEGDDLPF